MITDLCSTLHLSHPIWIHFSGMIVISTFCIIRLRWFSNIQSFNPTWMLFGFINTNIYRNIIPTALKVLIEASDGVLLPYTWNSSSNYWITGLSWFSADWRILFLLNLDSINMLGFLSFIFDHLRPVSLLNLSNHLNLYFF